MQVQIIGGRAGRLLPYILPEIDRARRQEVRVLLLVPEQYTLQAERELIAGLKLPGLMDIDVLSPRRLTRRIRESGGHSGLAPLDASGRSMAIAQALTISQEQLTYYQRVAAAPNLPDKLSVLLADMQRAGMTHEMLAEYAGKLPSGALRAKTQDLSLIWQAYLDVIDGRFADETMQQMELVSRLIPSGVAQEAAKVCRSLTVTMTMDAKDAPDGRVFLTQRRSAAELMKCLEEQEIPVSWRYLPIGETDDRDPALQHMERWLFTRQAVPFEGEASALAVHAAATPYAEAA